MKALLQRVQRARVDVDGETVGDIGPGLLVFLGVLRGDGEAEAARLAERTAQFRCFADDAGRMNCSALELGRELLVVSQFTLAHEDVAGRRRGRRPSFDRAAEPELARQLYEAYAARLGALGLGVQTGRFAASMAVELVNDGPVTFLLEEPGAES